MTIPSTEPQRRPAVSAPIVGELRAVASGYLPSGHAESQMLLVTRLIDNYVLAVAVTDPFMLTGEPGLLVDGPDTLGGEPLVVWPGTETGLDTRVLGQHLGMLLDADEVVALRRHAEAGAPVEPPFTPSTEPYDGNGVHALLRTMQALCYLRPAHTIERTDA